MSQAREALASAEKLAPGLPFAKPESVQALRSQLAGTSGASANKGSNSRAPAAAAPVADSLPAAPSSSIPWGLMLALGGGAIAFAIFRSRKKAATAQMPPAAYAGAGPGAMQGGLNGQQSFALKR